MPHVHPNAFSLLRKTLGSKENGNFGECAAIAQDENLGVPSLQGHKVADWVRGAHVKGNPLRPGTVIAIFDSNGVYVGQKHHYHKGGIAHTALYVRQSIEGIEVIHQFIANGQPQHIRRTFILFGGGKGIRACSPGWADQGIHDKSGVSGTGTLPEDNADNYYVVELRK